MSHAKKRTRSDSIDNDTDYQQSLTMTEHLQGCTASLTSTLNNLKLAVNMLDNVAPYMQKVSSRMQVDRIYDTMTVGEVVEARGYVTGELNPEIDWYLNEVQTALDQMALEAKLLMDYKAKIQSSASTAAASPPPPTRKVLNALELEELGKRWQASQEKLQALDVEKKECGDTLAAVELETAQLDRELERKQQIQDDAYYDRLAKEEAQLIEELEAIREQREQPQSQQQQQQEQQQEQQEQEQVQHQQQQQQIMERTKMKMDQVPLTKDTFKEQISLMKDCIEYLRGLSPNIGIPIDMDILQSYLVVLEQELVKAMDLKPKLINNRTILKQYCKHVLRNKTMGFVAQKLVDLVFTDQGFRKMTLSEILEKFDSARHKDIVKQLVERYPGFNDLIV